MMRDKISFFLLIFLSIISCQNSSSDADTDSGTADTDETDYQLTFGECKTDSDCQIGECVLFPDSPSDGWPTCKLEYMEATGPSKYSPEFDECSTSDDCMEEKLCFFNVYRLATYNTCYANDECESDTDCPSPETQMCVLAGFYFLPTSKCLDVECKVNSDCTEGENGVCVPQIGWLGIESGTLLNRVCAYKGAECLQNSDCTGQDYDCLISEETNNLTCQYRVAPGA
jgi:hypothetical protein